MLLGWISSVFTMPLYSHPSHSRLMQWQSESCEEGFLSLLDLVLTGLGAAQVIAVLAALSKLHKFQAESGDSKARKESWLFTGFTGSVNIYSARFQKICLSKPSHGVLKWI